MRSCGEGGVKGAEEGGGREAEERGGGVGQPGGGSLSRHEGEAPACAIAGKDDAEMASRPGWWGRAGGEDRTDDAVDRERIEQIRVGLHNNGGTCQWRRRNRPQTCSVKALSHGSVHYT